MTTTGSTEQHRTKQWTLHLQLFEEGDLTTVHAVLDTGDNTLRSRATARRSPDDPAVPEIGDEFAAGRALVDLGHQLLRAGTTDAAAFDPDLHS
ncbi:dsRBD fold-containing protein [Kitasatospora sp. NPDC050543]|uniref:dsRBD fold-containing protein n=1 Tax=Kitasatospora sp. NPDC050543 TaxID=3364054 RepID=UPI0037893D4E